MPPFKSKFNFCTPLDTLHRGGGDGGVAARARVHHRAPVEGSEVSSQRGASHGVFVGDVSRQARHGRGGALSTPPRGFHDHGREARQERVGFRMTDDG